MIIAFIVLVVLFGLFGWWNQAPAPIQFLGWHYETSVGLAVIVPLILGLLIGFGISWGKQQLLRALRRHEPITIYGDYDADGVSATSILLRGLQALGGEVSFYIPSRFTEGYGLNDAALQRLAEGGRHLVVSVDCGVTAAAEIARAGERKQDVIVVDHHEPGPALPPAVAVVDPKRRDAGASFREYSAAGLAFQVLRAVRS